MLDLYLLVVGQDDAECAEFNAANVDCDLHVVANPENRPLAAIANEHMGLSTCSVFGMVHPDVFFGPGALAAFHAAASSGQLCGLVGRNLKGEYRWCYEGPGPVYALDDCSVFLRPDCGLRFDEHVPDAFQGYVTELCIQAQQRGVPVVVPEADAKHPGKRFFTDYEGRQTKWNACLERIRQKWPGVEFITT
jgi:hypothetical protein